MRRSAIAWWRALCPDVGKPSCSQCVTWALVCFFLRNNGAPHSALHSFAQLPDRTTFCEGNTIWTTRPFEAKQEKSGDTNMGFYKTSRFCRFCWELAECTHLCFASLGIQVAPSVFGPSWRLEKSVSNIIQSPSQRV